MLERSNIPWLETMYPDLAPEEALAQAFATGKFIAAEGDTVAGLFAPIEQTTTLEKIANFKIRNRDKGFIVLSPNLEAIAPYIDFARFRYEEWITLSACGLHSLGFELIRRAKETGKVNPAEYDYDVWVGKLRTRAETDLMLKTETSLNRLYTDCGMRALIWDRNEAYRKLVGENPTDAQDPVNNLFWGLLEFAPFYIDWGIAYRLDDIFLDEDETPGQQRKGTQYCYGYQVERRDKQLAQNPEFRTLMLEVILNYINGTQQQLHEVKLHPADFTPYLKPLQEYAFAHNFELDDYAEVMELWQGECDTQVLNSLGMQAGQEINYEVWNKLLNSPYSRILGALAKKWVGLPYNPVTQIKSLTDLYHFLDWLLLGAHAMRAKTYGQLDNWRYLKAHARSKQPVSLYKTMSNAALFGITRERRAYEAYTDHGITYIFPANRDKCPPQLIGEHDTIAVRFVAQQGYNDHPPTQMGARETVVLNYVRKYQQPVVTTSVNLSGSKTSAISLTENLSQILVGHEVAQKLQQDSQYQPQNAVQEAWVNAFTSTHNQVTPELWESIFAESFISTQTDLDNTQLHEQGHWVDPSAILHLRRGILRNSARLSAAYKYTDICNTVQSILWRFEYCFDIYVTSLLEWPKRYDEYAKDAYRDAEA